MLIVPGVLLVLTVIFAQYYVNQNEEEIDEAIMKLSKRYQNGKKEDGIADEPRKIREKNR
ncbi:MAG: hypothetical protein ABEK59_02180 [Halobacteria archaeon]